VGFEIRRSDTPQITKIVQRKVMDLILYGQNCEGIREYLTDIVLKYRAGKFTLDEVGIPGGIGKGLDDYETDDAQVRGAKYSNKHLKTDFKQGSKPKRVYIKGVNGVTYPRTDVLCFEYGDQVPEDFIIDWETMLEKTIKQPISRITDALGWNWDELISPGKTVTKQGTFDQFG